MKNILIGIAVFVLTILFSFIGGCQYNKTHSKPIIVSDTVRVYDTTDHYIYNIWPWYVEGKDTTIYVDVPADVDTALILKDYFASHVYSRKWENDTLRVNLLDTVSQNRFAGNNFHYRIKIPFTTVNTTIDKSVHYSKYIYIGASLPVYPPKVNTISNINYVAISGLYAFNKGYFNVYWQPYIKTFTFGTGITLFRFAK
jgi:hypothetical protein